MYLYTYLFFFKARPTVVIIIIIMLVVGVYRKKDQWSKMDARARSSCSQLFSIRAQQWASLLKEIRSTFDLLSAREGRGAIPSSLYLASIDTS